MNYLSSNTAYRMIVYEPMRFSNEADSADLSSKQSPIAVG